jgi:hypothetical protein
MTDAHAGHTSSPGPAFTEAQWHEFHTSDKAAGAAVILLMTSIFGIGLVLYATVAIIVAL